MCNVSAKDVQCAAGAGVVSGLIWAQLDSVTLDSSVPWTRVYKFPGSAFGQSDSLEATSAKERAASKHKAGEGAACSSFVPSFSAL